MRSLASDPLRNFKFKVTIAGNKDIGLSVGEMGFMTVDGLGIQNEVIAYREGGDNTTTRKMPGQTDFGPITLGHGMLAAPAVAGNGSPRGNELYRWQLMVFSVMEGQGTASIGDNFRCDVTIDVLEHPTVGSNYGAGVNRDNWLPVKARFYVYNAWPMGINWSALDAGGNAVVIETLQLAHEGFDVTYGSTNPGPRGLIAASAPASANRYGSSA